jgi:hypothetical protein
MQCSSSDLIKLTRKQACAMCDRSLLARARASDASRREQPHARWQSGKTTCAIDHAGVRTLRCTALLAHRCVCTSRVECRRTGRLQLTTHVPTAPRTVRCWSACLRAAALALQRLAAPSLPCCSVVCAPIALHLAHSLALTHSFHSLIAAAVKSECTSQQWTAPGGNF